MLLAIKSRLIGTRIESLAKRVQWLANVPHRLRNPDMAELFRESELLPQILGKLLRTDSNVIDVGCHIGSFISLVLQLAPRGLHVLIEPAPSKAAWLRAKFPSLTIHQLAVADRCGEADFTEDLAQSGFSHLGQDRLADNVVCYKVRVATLDELIQQRVDLVKLDIEGAELAGLQGAAQTISRYRPAIIFECGSENSLAAVGVSRRELFDFLTDHLRYSIYTFSDFVYGKGPLSFDEFRKCGLYPFRAFNFLALV